MALTQPQAQELAPLVEVDPTYPQRADRLYDAPCAQNAQGLFSPDACLFVGNLSIRVPAEKLSKDLQALYSRFGKCHVKIKYDGKRRLPTAFLQFEKVDDAMVALLCSEHVYLHNRRLRVEKAFCRRTCILGLRSGAPMNKPLYLEAINKRGPLEFSDIHPELAYNIWGECYVTQVCRIIFVYVQDCLEAIQHFENSLKFYLYLEPEAASPQLSQASTSSNWMSNAGSSSVTSNVNWRSSQSPRSTKTSTSTSTKASTKASTSAGTETSTLTTSTSSDSRDCEWRYPRPPRTPDQERKIRPRSPSQPPKHERNVVIKEGPDKKDDKTELPKMQPVCAGRKRSNSISN
ncbi:hypothetical protein VTN77DRAFT_9699 [Rasamsonia byssochlamydoides]|uniref:uncharacterized protein n=1 Tax=Rasamsonia byssochlamydoides TaxID=89139 RepID=UPI003743D281